MPPKASKKNVEKKKEKIIEDKTFGLKNKNKSAKVKQFVAMVEGQVKGGGESARDKALKEQKKKDAEMKKMAESSLAGAFTEILVQPKLKFGEDPKGILCVHFKTGNCTKGRSCKFSHDLEVTKKSAKRNLNVDTRDIPKEEDTMDTWTEDKLKDVVKKKAVAQTNATSIICKYFLEALDKELYGWFWICPNGGDGCKYRHSLPEGYVFKTKRERDAERMAFLEAGGKTGLDIFEIIEIKRSALPKTGLTPVTLESLAKWKEDRVKKDAEILAKKKKEEAKKKNLGPLGVMTGRALFMYDASLFVDDEEAVGGDIYKVTESLEYDPDTVGEALEELDIEEYEEGDDDDEEEEGEGEEGDEEEEEEEAGGEEGGEEKI